MGRSAAGAEKGSARRTWSGGRETKCFTWPVSFVPSAVVKCRPVTTFTFCPTRGSSARTITSVARLFQVSSFFDFLKRNIRDGRLDHSYITEETNNIYWYIYSRMELIKSMIE
jgi:hypothetical protein